jgi:thiol-disulfide isomerase/thioredoxin
MQFIEANSWEEVVAKAKSENKYIFLDAYTTWCGPCIMMAKKVFPQPEVGEFYNANFINVKVQLDTTGKDNDHIKRWYKDGNMLANKYGIRAYPTYIFFSPDGEAVHRAVGSSDPQTFINKGKDALDPDKQYYRLATEFGKGNRDAAFLKKLISAAQNAYDRQNLPAYAKAFYQAEKDLLNPENLKLIAQLTETSKDTGFVMMQQYPDKFDDALGKPGEADKIVSWIILREEVYPIVTKGGEIVGTEPDWTLLKKQLEAKYPAYASAALLQGKIMYYRAKGNFPLFAASVSELMNSDGKKLSAEMLNGYAWEIFEKCDDIKCIQEALVWSKKSLETNKDPLFIDTYANLLHKSGNTKDAIIWQQKAIDILKAQGEGSEEFEEILEKMKKGEKTWN